MKRFDKTLHAPGTAKKARRLRGSLTLLEQALWKAIRKTGLHVRRQAPIGRYVADFALHEARLIIEVDGGWHDEPEVQLRDIERDAWLAFQGYRVLRFRNQQVFDDLDGVVDAIMNSFPPRWGKGGVGGAGNPSKRIARGAATPPILDLQPTASTPTPPSPIEGEGFDVSGGAS